MFWGISGTLEISFLAFLATLGFLVTLFLEFLVTLDFLVISAIWETLFWVFLGIWDSLVTFMDFQDFSQKMTILNIS